MALNRRFRVAFAGFFLSITAASALLGILFGAGEKAIPGDSGAWDRYFSTPIKAARKESKGIYVDGTKKNGEGNKYYLYNLNRGFDGKFNLPFTMEKTDYDKIQNENITVSLFESPAWENGDRDKFKSVPQEELNTLFSSVDAKDHHKVKELLLKLSLGKRWRIWSTNYIKTYWDEKDYYNKNQFEKPKNGSFSSEIKYFMDFGDLKNYILEKIKSCKDRDTCSPDEDDPRLHNLWQDRSDFFSLPQQKESNYSTSSWTRGQNSR